MPEAWTPEIDLARERLAQAVRVLANGGILTLSVGHASCRIGDDRILILGHTHKAGKTLNKVGKEDIVAIDLEGRLVNGSLHPPGERFIHTAIYKRRPDVNAVIHAHPLLPTAFSMGGVPVRPAFTRGVQFHPEVRISNLARQINTPETGDSVALELGQDCALLLRGHGIIVTGANLEEACCNAFNLETNAKIQLIASLVGEFVPLSPDEVGGRDEKGEKHVTTSVWPYFVDKFDKGLE